MDKENFSKGTAGVFVYSEVPNRKPDFISKSGSKYWFGKDAKGEYVIRQSTHWSEITPGHSIRVGNSEFYNGNCRCGRIRTCCWILHIPKFIGSCSTGKEYVQIFIRANCGKIYFADFYEEVVTSLAYKAIMAAVKKSQETGEIPIIPKTERELIRMYLL